MAFPAVNLMNIGDLLEEMCKYFPDPEEEEDPNAPVQIAVVGQARTWASPR